MLPAFGLAGVNLHTWTGFGSVPYWNTSVAANEMHGSGVYFAKLAALHFYQLAIPAPQPPAGSFDDGFFRLGLTEPEKNDLIQHLLGL